MRKEGPKRPHIQLPRGTCGCTEHNKVRARTAVHHQHSHEKMHISCKQIPGATYIMGKNGRGQKQSTAVPEEKKVLPDRQVTAEFYGQRQLLNVKELQQHMYLNHLLKSDHLHV